MEQQTVIVEAEYRASIEKVWNAITDKNQMKEWYFDLDEFRAEIGFEFRFTGQGQKGENYVHICRVTEVIPYKKLKYSWTYDNIEGLSYVSFELFDQGDTTRLRLTHEGLESFPQHNADFKRSSFEGGWNELIPVSLKKFVEG